MLGLILLIMELIGLHFAEPTDPVFSVFLAGVYKLLDCLLGGYVLWFAAATKTRKSYNKRLQWPA